MLELFELSSNSVRRYEGSERGLRLYFRGGRAAATRLLKAARREAQARSKIQEATRQEAEARDSKAAAGDASDLGTQTPHAEANSSLGVPSLPRVILRLRKKYDLLLRHTQ